MVLLTLLSLFLLSALAQELRYNLVIPNDENCLSDQTGWFECIPPPPPCRSMKQHHDLRKKEAAGDRYFLLYGHNGLRNRLAKKLNTVDMLHVTWDDRLAELSNRHHRHCQRQLNDSETESIIADEEIQNRTTYSSKPKLSRNSFFWPDIYVNKFFEIAVGTWYSRHQRLKFPKERTYNGLDHLMLIGENSFTHIINPRTYRMGCSFA